MDGVEEHPPLTETIIGLLVVVMVGTQTWVVVQEATQGEAGRRVRSWWEQSFRPFLVRLTTWIDARAIIEQMVSDEIEPLLRGEA